MTSTIAQTSSSPYNNVKNDTKSYPTFNEQTKDWKYYKTKFSSVATIHGIFYLMEENYLSCDLSDTNCTQATNDSTFQYSVLEYSLATCTAISRIKKNLQIQEWNIRLERTGEVV